MVQKLQMVGRGFFRAKQRMGCTLLGGSERAFAHMQLRLAGSLFASNEVRYRAPFFACLSNVV